MHILNSSTEIPICLEQNFKIIIIIFDSYVLINVWCTLYYYFFIKMIENILTYLHVYWKCVKEKLEKINSYFFYTINLLFENWNPIINIILGFILAVET